MDEMIRVEETVNDDHLTIKAEMPGIDPAKDVEIEFADGLLTISAERREEEKTEDNGRTVSEFRYGSFRRTLRVPKDAKPEDVTAEYKDGILTILVPLPKATTPEVTKVAVTRG
jgi:HSP20 family protein